MKIHLDLDCYFVSAERTRYPFLKNRNVVVAKSSDSKIFANGAKESVLLGDSGAFNSLLEFKNNYQGDILNLWKEHFIDENGSIHGIVIAKSYEAKRYGIQTGTPLKEALVLCKDLIVIPSDHLFYQELSQKLKKYLRTQLPLLEQYSIDEFFADLSGWVKAEDTLAFITKLQADILKEFDLPISIGASNSKWIAKLTTDQIKPFGVKVVPEKEVASFIKDIAIEDFPGIGRALCKRLRSCGIKTLGELKEVPSLLAAYGKSGKELYLRAQGRDNEPVVANQVRKSIAIGRNFKAIQSRQELYRRTTILARYLSHSIIKLGYNPATFFFKIKYEYGLSSKVSLTHYRLFNEKFLIDLALESVRKLDYNPSLKIHYISISASNFMTPTKLKTLSLLEYEEDRKRARLQRSLLKIRDKYGIDALYYGSERG